MNVGDIGQCFACVIYLRDDVFNIVLEFDKIANDDGTRQVGVFASKFFIDASGVNFLEFLFKDGVGVSQINEAKLIVKFQSPIKDIVEMIGIFPDVLQAYVAECSASHHDVFEIVAVCGRDIVLDVSTFLNESRDKDVSEVIDNFVADTDRGEHTSCLNTVEIMGDSGQIGVFETLDKSVAIERVAEDFGIVSNGVSETVKIDTHN